MRPGCVMVSNSFTNPGLTYDNGTACTVSAPFLTSSVPGTCNNGHEVYNAGTAAMVPTLMQLSLARTQSQICWPSRQ